MKAAPLIACVVAGAALGIVLVHTHGGRDAPAPAVAESPVPVETIDSDRMRLWAIEVELANQREALAAVCMQMRVLVRRGDPRAKLIGAAEESCPLPEVSP